MAIDTECVGYARDCARLAQKRTILTYANDPYRWPASGWRSP